MKDKHYLVIFSVGTKKVYRNVNAFSMSDLYSLLQGFIGYGYNLYKIYVLVDDCSVSTPAERYYYNQLFFGNEVN